MLEYICIIYAAIFFLVTLTLYRPIWTANLTSLTYGYCRTVKKKKSIFSALWILAYL